MADVVPNWIFAGATVWAWLPQQPHRVYPTPTRWECTIIEVKPARSRTIPLSVILSVPTEVFKNKSFRQYFPEFTEFVDHPNDPNSQALPLNLYRNNKLMLEQVEAPPSISVPPIAAAAAATQPITFHEDDITFESFCSQNMTETRTLARR